jgi:hypothetical protein
MKIAVHGRIAALWLGLALAGCTVTPAPATSPPLSTAVPGVVPSAQGSTPPTPPPGSLSRDVASELARTHAPGATAATVVVWAKVEPDPWASAVRSPGATAGPDRGGLVWMVRLQGGGLSGLPCGDAPTPIPAGSSARPCLDYAGGFVVALDLVTGDFLGWLN